MLLGSDTISRGMYAALCRGRERCTEEALRLMSDFVQQHQDTGGGFVNRAGQPDLYYSMFALLLAVVLRAPTSGCGFDYDGK